MAEINPEYERGFKDGLKSECLKELKPIMVELAKGCTEAIKGIAPMLIDAAQLTIRQPANRWIPVEDALPEEDVSVLCYMRIGEIVVMEYGGDGWYCGVTRYNPRAVTHWMPLPSTEGLT